MSNDPAFEADNILPGMLVCLSEKVMIGEYTEPTPNSDDGSKTRTITLLKASELDPCSKMPYGYEAGIFLCIEYIRFKNNRFFRMKKRLRADTVDVVDVPLAVVMFGEHTTYVNSSLLKLVF